MTDVLQSINLLANSVHDLTTHNISTMSSGGSTVQVKVSQKAKDPERFKGEKPEELRYFLSTLDSVFSQEAQAFDTPRSKVVYAINHLAGKADFITPPVSTPSR